MKPAPEYNEVPHLKEALPSGGDRENYTTPESDIPPDNSLWDYIQENGTGPLEESPKHQRAWGIVYYYFHNFLHGTGISGFARNSSYNF